MARSRAVLSDPDRRFVSEAIMEAQALQMETARLLHDHAVKAIHQTRALRKAQERMTAAEIRSERDCWDGGECRRRSERRVRVAA